MSSPIGSNNGPASSVTTNTNSSSIEKPTPIKATEVTSEAPVLNEDKELALSSADLDQDPASLRKRKRVISNNSDSEVPSTPAANGQESPVDSSSVLKRKKSENTKDEISPDDSLDELDDDSHQNNNNASLTATSGLPANVDILEELYTLRASLANVVAKLPKPSSSAKSPLQSNLPWGSLVPTNTQQATVPLKGSTFTVGRNAKCSMCIGDTHIASVLFKIHFTNGVALFECTSNNGTIYINGKVFKRNSKVILKDGDEITINGSKVYAYTFRESSLAKTPVEITATTTVTPMVVDGKEVTSTTAVASPIATAVRNRRRGPHFMVASPGFVPPPLSDDPVLPHSNFLASLFPAPNNNSNDGSTPAANAEMLRKKFKEEFSKNIISFKDITTTFDKFPYYIQDNVKHQLINSAYIYLKRPDYVKYLNESPITRRLMICGPTGTELYQESLVKALANEFKANLLIVEASTLDIEKDKEKDKEKAEDYSSDEMDDWDPEIRPRKERKMGLGRLMRGANRSNNKVVITVADGNERRSYDASSAEPKEEDKSEVEIIWETLIDSVSDSTQPHILLIKDIDSLFFTSTFKQLNLKKIFNKITTPLFIIGSSVSVEMRRENTMQSGLLVSKGNASHTTALLDIAFLDHFARMGERAKDRDKVAKISNKLFPNKINIAVPTDPNELSEWNSKINQDIEQIKMEKNAKNLKKITEKNQIQVEEVNTPLFSKTVYSPESIEKIAGFALSHHIMHSSEENLLNNGNLVLPLKSLEHGIKILKNGETTGKPKNLKEIEPENDFERRLLSEVIPPNEIDIKFEDIGALDDVKQTLKELVMLPLRRPELFARGNLTKPTKGILLFGPPGTGKTMLAKAVATQCGANFINISMSSIASKWFGECEKFVKAIFTLASKISPTVIFVDEVDSMLGKRDKHGEHETMRKIKNEFMSNWDGLKSRDGERVIVLAASNRPFDLDDAVLRRLPRRVLVDLPDKDNRAKILKVILSKEDLAPNFDFVELAQMTEGYSGSDLKNLSIAAAYKPIREVLQKEKEEGLTDTEVKSEVKLRALTMKDFEKSLEEVSASVSEDAVSIGELRKWNDLYGEKGSRKKQLLPYFL